MKLVHFATSSLRLISLPTCRAVVRNNNSTRRTYSSSLGRAADRQARQACQTVVELYIYLGIHVEPVSSAEQTNESD